jgi:prepilin-type N-terminal cleavage/methylation domain-containing protein
LDKGSQAESILPAPISTTAEFERNPLVAWPTGRTRTNSGRLSGTVGFSLIEIMVVLLIMGILTVIALPSAINSLKGYRLHADGTAISSYLNVVRMKSASQYAPYRLVVRTNTSPASYVMEKLCGSTPSAAPGDSTMNPPFDTNCTGSYQTFTTPQLEGGMQYGAKANTYSTCRPTTITGTTYPGTITGATPCNTTLYIYFNTRGSPVDSTGNPLSNGGAVLYIQGENRLVDAITVSIGGRVATYMWGGTGWGLR